MADDSIEWPDILIIVLYFVIVLGVALWASCTAKKSNASGYFLAGRNMHWIPIGASTFSTNVGAPMFLGLAGSAAASGISVTMFEWHAMWMLLLLGWIFLPVYISSGCFTMPQYLQLRYGGKRIRTWLAILYMILTVISQISGQLYAGVVFVQQIFKWNIYISIIAILAVTGVFTIIGGLTAVIWTDTIQTIILLGGATTVAVFALISVNGYESMSEQYMGAAANYTYRDAGLYGNRTCGFPPEDSFHIFRAADSPSYPWPGMIFGLTVLALNAWCTDQLCVQRSLSARNMSHAKAGVVLAAYLKITSYLFFIIPGMCSRVLFPQEVACADPIECERICNNKAGCYDIAYPLLVLRILPTGVRGLMMAALLSALVSSLTSIFNSSSTVFTIDLWSICRPKAKEAEKMIVGRLWILVMVIVGTLWIPVLQMVQGSQFWAYSQSISSFLLPPVVMTFLFGIFWKRATEQGAFWGMMAGLAVGAVRMGLEWSRVSPPCGSTEPNTSFLVVTQVNYLHFAIILSGVSSLVIIVVSLLTAPRSENKLRRVTWWTRDVKEFPDASDDEEEVDIKLNRSNDEKSSDFGSSKDDYPDNSSPVKNFFLKWFCGLDKNEDKVKLTVEERRQLALEVTNIAEDPFWKKFMDVNGIICAVACFFLHGFWA